MRQGLVGLHHSKRQSRAGQPFAPACKIHVECRAARKLLPLSLFCSSSLHSRSLVYVLKAMATAGVKASL